MKIPTKEISIYLYMFLLLALSGNPFFNLTDTRSKVIFSVFVLLMVIRHFRYFIPENSIRIYQYLGFFTGIFIFQRLVLGYISVQAAFSFLSKIILGYIIIRYLGRNFRYAYFQVLFFICLISLFGFAWNSMGFDIPYLLYTPPSGEYSFDEGRNLLLFHQNDRGLRNSGMFWEPGAFGCYIALAFMLYLGNIKNLIKYNKFKSFIILLALITTFSTTAYLVLIAVGILTIYFEYSKKYGLLILPVLLIAGASVYFLYKQADFLSEKIDHQVGLALERDRGEFAPDRFSALIFDWHYIKKHPLTGNGFDTSTRYADHPWVLEKAMQHGNGFSNFIASMGVLSFLFYSFFILKFNENKPVSFLFLVVILLQGEPLLNYPVFLSLPFVFIYSQSLKTAPAAEYQPNLTLNLLNAEG